MGREAWGEGHQLGRAHDTLSNRTKALEYYERALPRRRQVGDRWGESVTCSNMAMLYGGLGDLARAEQLLTRTVELEEMIGRPDLHSDRAALGQVRRMLRASEEQAGRPGTGKEQAGGLAPAA